MQLSDPWTSHEVSASGQVFEFRLWALLTEQSRGTLHMFLPRSDGDSGTAATRADATFRCGPSTTLGACRGHL